MCVCARLSKGVDSDCWGGRFIIQLLCVSKWKGQRSATRSCVIPTANNCLFIYIYIYREREREREHWWVLCHFLSSPQLFPVKYLQAPKLQLGGSWRGLLLSFSQNLLFIFFVFIYLLWSIYLPCSVGGDVCLTISQNAFLTSDREQRQKIHNET